MANTSIYAGYVPQPGRWHSGVKLGGVNTPPIEFDLDQTLPDLGRDPLYPNRDFIVIPRGRFVATKSLDLQYVGGKSLITVANGVDPNYAPSYATGTVPFGYAPFHMYRTFSGLPADKPLGVKHETIELPYTSVNDSYSNALGLGTRLTVGEWVMPYYGSATAKIGTPVDKGKPVRWIPRKVYQTTATASGVVLLTSAPFPAFKPRILAAFTAAGVPVFSGTTQLDYSEANGKWQATFGTTVTTVMYEYGASDDQRIGQIVGVEPVGTASGLNSTSHDITGWLKWITDNFSAWDWPPIMNVRPTNTVTSEVVSIDANNEGNLAYYPVVPFRTVTVVVSGSIANPDGTTTALSNTTMETADTLFFNDQTQGKYYDIDFLTGRIRFASNVTVYSCAVSYYYEGKFRDGLKYDAGILGLTDGLNSGLVGLPPHLDVAGVKGVLRIMVL
jgi:hypothetical protein